MGAQPAKEPSGIQGDSGGGGVKGAGKKGKGKCEVAKNVGEATDQGESVAGKAGKGKGGGKGKGAGKAPPSKKAGGPSRTEKEAWVAKKKSAKVPKLRWKRRLESDNLVNISESFAE